MEILNRKNVIAAVRSPPKNRDWRRSFAAAPQVGDQTGQFHC